MFGAKSRFKQYLAQIKPYAMGIDNRGWYPSDFANPQMRENRLDPTHVIFAIPEPPMTWFDALLLSPKQYGLYINLRQAVSNFNSARDVANSARRDLADTYYGLIALLHIATIGTSNTGGLYDAFNLMEGSLR